MRRRILAIALGLVLIAGAGCHSVPAGGGGNSDDASAPAAPGAAGLGDPYFPRAGNGGYDVASYAVDIRVDLAPARLTGRTAIQATATQALSAFHLDFALAVDEVTIDGLPAQHDQQGSEVVITPRRPLLAGVVFTTVVTYHSEGRPQGWHLTPAEVVATGEPRIAEWWFPSNDHPRDAARFDVTVDVPRGRQGISVGRLLSEHQTGDRTRWHWQAAEPMQTYAAFFAVGGFDLVTETVSGVVYTYAVSQELSPADRATNLRLLQQTPDVVAGLQEDFGRYPYADGGGLVTTTIATEDWAMENQTRPTYPPFRKPREAQRLLTHEVAHQWFGDWVRPHSWRDIVNNEGFARWSELRATERTGGPDADSQLRDWWIAHPAADDFWRLPLDDPGPEHLFDLPVYDRGAMMVQALRNRLGHERFAEFLRQWLSTYGGRTASVADLEALAGQVSGDDLSTFFDAWLRDPKRPAATAANGFRSGR